LLGRLLTRLVGPQLEAQRAFNAEQVRLDNALLRHLDERFAATHAHYDGLLGGVGRRLDEVDERHAQLTRELVAHVHDLARRIDLVLAEADRGRPALEHALRELRERVARLEDALRPHAR
jgi:DNA-binding ferritin-like protein